MWISKIHIQWCKLASWFVVVCRWWLQTFTDSVLYFPWQPAAGNIINMLWQLMENGLEELKLLQTVLVLLTTNTVVHDEVLSKVEQHWHHPNNNNDNITTVIIIINVCARPLCCVSACTSPRTISPTTQRLPPSDRWWLWSLRGWWPRTSAAKVRRHEWNNLTTKAGRYRK